MHAIPTTVRRLLMPAAVLALVLAALPVQGVAAATVTITGTTAGPMTPGTVTVLTTSVKTLTVAGSGTLHHGTQHITVTQQGRAVQQTLDGGFGTTLTACSGEHGTLTTAVANYTYLLPSAPCTPKAGIFTYSGTVTRNTGGTGSITVTRTVTGTTVVDLQTRTRHTKWTYADALTITLH